MEIIGAISFEPGTLNQTALIIPREIKKNKYFVNLVLNNPEIEKDVAMERRKYTIQKIIL
tara:strand:- start:32 stop:211 length:180 start_codon:yes stop_codon:yes gene_type:complete